jgi:hypothetical protein
MNYFLKRSLHLLILAFTWNSVLAQTAKPVNILFIGNSLTYTNDLPGIVTEIGVREGKQIGHKNLLFPDYSLGDHWKDGLAAEEISKGIYDYVIVQQGPSALPESQVLLLEYTRRFAGICNDNKTKLLLYMVWPSKSRSFDLDRVINSYTTAAEKTGSLLCPAGLAWKIAWQEDPALPLYGPDNFHPGMAGTVLAAMTIYAVLENKKDFDFLKYEKCSWKDVISENSFLLLKAAAVKATR